MKWLSIFMIIFMSGCIKTPVVKPCKTIGKTCTRSIVQSGPDCFNISVNRHNLNKINKGTACLKLDVQTIKTIDGWSSSSLALFVAGAAVLFFSGGFMVGAR